MRTIATERLGSVSKRLPTGGPSGRVAYLRRG
jgi:hypothetical protein